MRDLVDDLVAGRWTQETFGDEAMSEGVGSVALETDRVIGLIASHQLVEVEGVLAEGIDLLLGEITPVAVLLGQSHQPTSWDFGLVVIESLPEMPIHVDVWRLDRVASHVNLLEERLPR